MPSSSPYIYIYMRPLALARIAITQAITKDFEFSQNLNFHSVKISLFSYYISFIHRLSLVFFFPYFWFSFHHLLLPPIVWFHFPHAKVKLFWPEMIPYSPIDGFGLWLYWFVLIEKYVVITKWCNFFLEIFYEEKYEREMQLFSSSFIHSTTQNAWVLWNGSFLL